VECAGTSNTSSNVSASFTILSIATISLCGLKIWECCGAILVAFTACHNAFFSFVVD
jgi:hypothetical protein